MPDASERANLSAFAQRVYRLDPTAVLRLRLRGARFVRVWAPTGFDVLAVRTIAAKVWPSDASVAADTLVAELAEGKVEIDLGYSMDSAWRGGLPPDTDWRHVDDVPAAVITELAAKGAVATQDSGAVGPPKSLMDQAVLHVEADGETIEVTMRAIFALTAMGFIPESVQPDEVVRVRANRRWVRLDARFGSVVYQTGGLNVLTN